MTTMSWLANDKINQVAGMFHLITLPTFYTAALSTDNITSQSGTF